MDINRLQGNIMRFEKAKAEAIKEFAERITKQIGGRIAEYTDALIDYDKYAAEDMIASFQGRIRELGYINKFVEELAKEMAGGQ